MDHRDSRAQAAFARFAWGVLGYTVLVVLWGAFVRATGSGAGCGAHWPRCNGTVLPRSPSAETLIELTHRATSGIALLAVVAMLVLAFRRFPAGHPARLGAVLSMVLMLTEAGVGAGLVLLELVAGNASAARAGWMAAHLLNTFLLLGAIALTARWAAGAPAVRLRGQGAAPALALAALGVILLIGMTGAVTALGDTLFPKAGVGLELSRGAHFLERLRVVHPVLAVGGGLFVVYAAAALGRLRPSRESERLSRAVHALFWTQVAAGALNVALLAPVWLQLVHLLLADALWLALVLLAASALADAAPAAGSAGERSRPAPAAV